MTIEQEMMEIFLEFLKASPIAGVSIFICWLLVRQASKRDEAHAKQLDKISDSFLAVARESNAVMRENSSTLAALKTTIDKTDGTMNRVHEHLVRLDKK